jgi:hypothetical protein
VTSGKVKPSAGHGSLAADGFFPFGGQKADGSKHLDKDKFYLVKFIVDA